MAPKSKVNPIGQILEFLLERNRPYSATNLVDEMHGEFTKTVIQKALDQLVDENKITCKLAGKSSKLYFAKQEGKQVASKEELVVMDQHNDELSHKLQDLQKLRDELRARRDVLSSTRKLDELRQYRVEIEQQCGKKAQYRDKLIESAQGINPEDIAKITKDYNTRCEQWKKRRAMCMDILNTICGQEGMDKKPADIIEEQGLETDEQYHVKLEFKDRKYTIVDV
ncbi:hypothetical protein TVAG_151700 [Trichomonas vaginalis G3]|uniref:Homologous-pairing protein 2 homolog n=2 Tax=Trichomonas vaginalis TaxID=5722 RepID=A2ELT5_TRIV3|nr:hypothetical protein TVAG_151700 [Trichomonas vaginalis G3]|eukprot:XP_001318586.1 hypothetical protein [Trichomonas vaginalis G3]